MATKRRTVEVAAAPVRAVTAAKAVVAHEPDRAMVVIGLGDDLVDADLFALTLEEAGRLRSMIGRACETRTP